MMGRRVSAARRAKRFGDIYQHGEAGVSRDIADAGKWYNAARMLGCDVPARRQ